MSKHISKYIAVISFLVICSFPFKAFAQETSPFVFYNASEESKAKLAQFRVVKTSKLDPVVLTDTSNQKPLLVLCDSDFVVNTSLLCTSTQVLKVEQKLELLRYGGRSYFIGVDSSQNLVRIVIPASHFDTYAFSIAFYDFINAYHVSQTEAAAMSEKQEAGDTKQDEFDSTLYTTVAYIALYTVLFFCFVLLLSIFKTKLGQLSTYITESSAVSYQTFTRHALRWCIFIFVSLTAMFLLLLGLRESITFNLGQFTDFFVSLYKLDYSIVSTKAVMLLLLNLTIFGFVVEAVLYLIDYHSKVKVLLAVPHINSRASVILACFFLFFLLFDISKTVLLTYFLAACVVCLAVLIPAKLKYAKNKKTIGLLCLSFLSFIVVLALLSTRRDLQYSVVPLLTDATVIVAPYSKILESKERLAQTYVKPSGYLFFNNILLTSPTHTSIKNTAYTNYTYSDDDILITDYFSPYARHMLLQNERLVNLLKSDIPTNLVYLTNVNLSLAKNTYVLKVTLDCIEDYEQGTLKLMYYFDMNKSLDLFEEPALNYQACKLDSRGKRMYEVPLSFLGTRKFDNMFIDLISASGLTISNLEILHSGQRLPIMYMQMPNYYNNSLLVQRGRKAITVYSKLEVPLSVLPLQAEGFNIAQPINEVSSSLKGVKRINLRSPDAVYVIRNRYTE